MTDPIHQALALGRGPKRDLEVLVGRGRRALRVHLGTDVTAGLEQIRAAVSEALQAANT